MNPYYRYFLFLFRYLAAVEAEKALRETRLEADLALSRAAT